MSERAPMVLRPDSVVPQRELLLDRYRVARLLSSRLGANGPVPIESCCCTFVSYRVGRRVRVAYRIRIGGKDHHVAASSFRSSGRSARAYRDAMERGNDGGPLRQALHDTEHDTVFWTFPNDRRIANLSTITEGSPELTQALHRRWTRSCLVDYYPEVSAVVRCLDDSNDVVAYAKVHAGDEGERTHRAQQALVRAARGSKLRLARALVYSRRHNTLLVEPIVGRAIGRLEGPNLLSGLHAYGAALAALHSLPPTEVPPAPRPPLERLHRKARGIEVVRPDVEAMGAELLRDLDSRWDEAAGPPVFVHGDTNLNNAILQAERVAFIDFDRASMGSAGSDIGNTLGLMKYLRLLGLLSPAAEGERAAAFLRGYASVRNLPDASSLRVHVAVALAERAFRAVNRIRRRALFRLPDLLAEAKSHVASNGELW